MSVLVHLCRTCRHQQTWHEPRERAYTSCPCCRAGTAEVDAEPVLQETFAVPGWWAEPLYPPGATRNSGRMHATTCCDCDRCHAAYTRLTATPRVG